jgi:hypothetical protein
MTRSRLSFCCRHLKAFIQVLKFFISSPEHNVLMVSFCDPPLSVPHWWAHWGQWPPCFIKIPQIVMKFGKLSQNDISFNSCHFRPPYNSCIPTRFLVDYYEINKKLLEFPHTFYKQTLFLSICEVLTDWKPSTYINIILLKDKGFRLWQYFHCHV